MVYKSAEIWISARDPGFVCVFVLSLSFKYFLLTTKMLYPMVLVLMLLLLRGGRDAGKVQDHMV